MDKIKFQELLHKYLDLCKIDRTPQQEIELKDFQYWMWELIEG